MYPADSITATQFPIQQSVDSVENSLGESNIYETQNCFKSIGHFMQSEFY